MLKQQFTLLPEWAQQEAVILAWPHQNTDWVNNLEHVQATYLAIINAINSASAIVILLCAKDEIILAQSLMSMHSKVLIVPTEYNDTWVRDYAFLTVSDNIANYPISFIFNGWGQKYEANLDNQVNESLAGLCQQPLMKSSIVLEGGAVEIDENQHLITTASCLFNPKRNGQMTKQQYQALFVEQLGAKNVTIFNHGHLEGDDTDGHIDTLVRFTPLMGVVLQGASNRLSDVHYEPLSKLQDEVNQALPLHKVYSLPLPFVTNDSTNRLPASYANYLILNQHILMPIYNVDEDDLAIDIVQSAYPNYKIIQISCTSLVQQNGSLHCVSMQVPINTIKSEYIEKARSGVSIL